MREYSCFQVFNGGCYKCHEGEVHWAGKNALGVAARHHDATGHQTWVEITTVVVYGKPDGTRDSEPPGEISKEEQAE